MTSERFASGALREPIEVCVVIEIPRGSFLKRGSSECIDFVSPLPCPFNYGSVPTHQGLEGDLLDAVVLGPRLPLGTRLRVRAWDALTLTDRGMSDDKLICSAQPLRERERRAVLRFFRLYATCKGLLNLLRRRPGRDACDGWYGAHRAMARAEPRQLKARLLEHEVAVQVARETTLAPEDFRKDNGMPLRGLQDPATLAWNLATTCFFKAGGRPWQLGAPRPGVCYVGIVFKKDFSSPEPGSACCGAQMFLESGDGVVFRGAVGPWITHGDDDFHLPRDKARALMQMVVEASTARRGSTPRNGRASRRPCRLRQMSLASAFGRTRD